MNIQIRDACSDDRERIVEFNAAIAIETENKTLDHDILDRGVRRLLEDPQRGRYFLAEFEGRVIGQIMHTLEWCDWRDGWFWWIQSVYVDKSYRGQQVFSKLYRHLESLARSDVDVIGIRLYVDHDNQIAQGVYQSLGMTMSCYRVMEVLLQREGN